MIRIEQPMKKTKIVATLGPACDNKETLCQMIKMGMNVARINFSHGDHRTNGRSIDLVNELSLEMSMPIGVMADLQGPRIRTIMNEEMNIKKGELILIYDALTKKSKINPVYEGQTLKMVGLDWPGIIKNIEIENDILIEDGLMRVHVIKKKRECLIAEVISGGMVKNHKGVNIPDAHLQVGAITKKDEYDLKFALEKEVDYVALSFVSNRKEIDELRKKIKRMVGGGKGIPQIVAKIERKEAIKNIDEIISAADVIMVARGDLGIEMEESKVVIYQKEIVGKCLRMAKPVIVATQMLNSMIENPIPTRAEVSDVCNAVIDHTDAVMLSGETSSGNYPLASVKTMAEIIERTEESPYDQLIHGFLGDRKDSISAAVANSAHELSKDSGAKAIVVASVTGFTARMIARHRPDQAIYVMTNNKKTHNQLSLLWGTESFVLPDCKSLDDLIDTAVKILARKKLLQKGDKIVIVTGRPHIKKEHMSLVKVEEIK